MEQFEYYFNMAMTILGCFFLIGIVGYALIYFTAWLDAKSIENRLERDLKNKELKQNLINRLEELEELKRRYKK